MDVIGTLYTTRGAVSAVAARLGVSVPAVSQWQHRGIPEHRLEAVETALREYLDKLAATRPGGSR